MNRNTEQILRESLNPDQLRLEGILAETVELVLVIRDPVELGWDLVPVDKIEQST